VIFALPCGIGLLKYPAAALVLPRRVGMILVGRFRDNERIRVQVLLRLHFVEQATK